MSQFETPPLVDESDPVQVWLLEQWKQAERDRLSEKRSGRKAYNVGATIAAHKMQWIKELLADWRKKKGLAACFDNAPEKPRKLHRRFRVIQGGKQ